MVPSSPPNKEERSNLITAAAAAAAARHSINYRLGTALYEMDQVNNNPNGVNWSCTQQIKPVSNSWWRQVSREARIQLAQQWQYISIPREALKIHSAKIQ